MVLPTIRKILNNKGTSNHPNNNKGTSNHPNNKGTNNHRKATHRRHNPMAPANGPISKISAPDSSASQWGGSW